MDYTEEVVKILVNRGYPISSIRTEYIYGSSQRFDICVFSENGNLIQVFEIMKSDTIILDKQLFEVKQQCLMYGKEIQGNIPEFFLFRITKGGDYYIVDLNNGDGYKEGIEYKSGSSDFESILNYHRAIGRAAKDIQKRFPASNLDAWKKTNKIFFWLLLIYVFVYIVSKILYIYYQIDVPLSYELLSFILLIYILPFLHKIAPYIKRIKFLGVELETLYNEINKKPRCK